MKTTTLLLLSFFFGLTSSQAQSYTTNAEATLDLSSVTNESELLSVRYFYYPNLQAYFDRKTSTYLYTRNGSDWIESDNLPNGLRGYSMSNGKRVPLTEYDGDEPYEELDQHKKLYPANYSTKRPMATKNKESEGNTLALNE